MYTNSDTEQVSKFLHGSAGKNRSASPAAIVGRIIIVIHENLLILLDISHGILISN
jgi:hypothetical protein